MPVRPRRGAGVIPDDVVERVRRRRTSWQIIGEHVASNAWAPIIVPCPFHQGTHPNFSVSPRSTLLLLRVQEGGDVFTFLTKRLDSTGPARPARRQQIGIEVREAGIAAGGPRSARAVVGSDGHGASTSDACCGMTMVASRSDYLASRASIEHGGPLRIGYSPTASVSCAAICRRWASDDARRLQRRAHAAEEGREPRPAFRGAQSSRSSIPWVTGGLRGGSSCRATSNTSIRRSRHLREGAAALRFELAKFAIG